jgi:AcrR family transcriptional regulator
MANRMDPSVRKDQIMVAAVDEAVAGNYMAMRREDVAKRAGVAPGLVNRYYGTMSQLRAEVMRHAVDNYIVEVVAQGVAIDDPHTRRIDGDLRERAINHLIKG